MHWSFSLLLLVAILVAVRGNTEAEGPTVLSEVYVALAVFEGGFVGAWLKDLWANNREWHLTSDLLQFC